MSDILQIKPETLAIYLWNETVRTSANGKYDGDLPLSEINLLWANLTDINYYLPASKVVIVADNVATFGLENVQHAWT